MQNAEGGVHGHKLVGLVIDDQTNPSQIATAVQEADSKAFGIVSQSPLFFLAAKYPNQAGVPVTGTYDDGPEWGTQPYTNMFASDEGSVNPKYPVNTQIGDFLKQHGGTVLGSYGYGISPSSARAAAQTAQSFQHAGGKVGVLDTSVPFGSVDFTSAALTAKQDGVNAMVPAMDANSNYALAEALQQSGVKLKATLYATGYEPDVINSPAWNVLQGSYFLSLFRPFSLPNAGTEQMQAAMEKYAHFTKTQFPNLGQYEAWAGADLMIKGLEMGGSTPSRSAVIKDLRSLKSYNVNGLLPADDRLLHDLRQGPAQAVHLDHAGGEDRVQGGLRAAVLRDGHPRDLDGFHVVVTRRPLSLHSPPAHRRRGRVTSGVRPLRRSAQPPVDPPALERLLAALDVVVVGPQEHQARHLGQGLAPGQLVGHPDRTERPLDGHAPVRRRWPWPPTWPARAARRPGPPRRRDRAGGPGPPTCARAPRAGRCAASRPSGSFWSRWSDSKPATMP